MDFIEVNCKISAIRYPIERVGLAYHKSKQWNKESDTIENKSSTTTVGHVVDINYLKSLDPKEWKAQDHYCVLGLEKARFYASEEDIRRAYKAMVLQHHPDKRKAKGEEVKQDDDYFTCITKAYEILGTPKTRKAYDSVDPDFDDSMPTQSDIENNFFVSFNKYFKLNERWSERKYVPTFGNEDSKREDVEQFYSFWYDFKSWREFSYLDEEDKEKGQDRDERRWIEKENKAARIKRKKEEMMRIRTLVDLAYNNDKRIQRFKNEEKEKKLAAKRAKMDAVQAQKAEHERVLKEAQLAKERAEKAEQKRIEQIRIEKEQVKKALKRERKLLRDKCKECKYFATNDKDMLKNMEGVEKICEIYNLNELQELNKHMETTGKDSFFTALTIIEERLKAEQQEVIKQQSEKLNNTNSDIRDIKKRDLWDTNNVQLLIKAVNLFPAGTIQRWDVIATFINQHSKNGSNISARDVLGKAKALQSSDFSKSSLKTEANNSAFESFTKSKKDVQTCTDITVNNHLHSSNEINASAKLINNENKNQVKAWTKEEQTLLEQAMRTYPTSTPERWERIAECVPNRTKKECLRRVKEIVELLNSKKEAQLAVK